MRDAVIVDAVRTPVGRRRGGLSGIHPVDLSAVVLRALAVRGTVDPAEVDDVVWGCVGQVGEQALNIGRNAVLAAGWPVTVPGQTVERQCSSGQQAVATAAATVIAGYADLVIAGGVEVMSRVPLGASAEQSVGVPGGMPYGPAMRRRFAAAESFHEEEPIAFEPGRAAELIAARWELSRGRLDEYVLATHARAAGASDRGEFDAELCPVGPVVADECVRRDTSPQRLASLSTPFQDDGVVTAAASSQNADGAAALAVTTSEWAAAHGLRPLARIHTSVVVGDDPVMMLTGPIPATARALRRGGLTIDEIGVYEVNEAFAAIPLAWLAETGADPARLNPRGGAIALGHPLGASGARIATTLLHYLRDHEIRYGLQVMCAAGGTANAMILELL